MEKIRRKLEDSKRESNHADTRLVKAVIEAVERLRASLIAWIKKNRPALLKSS